MTANALSLTVKSGRTFKKRGPDNSSRLPHAIKPHIYKRYGYYALAPIACYHAQQQVWAAQALDWVTRKNWEK